MKLLSDRILVEPIVVRLTRAGLHLPDSDSSAFADGQFFRVLDVGPKCEHVAVGDTVFFHSYHQGAEDGPNGAKFIRERNVVLVIPKP